jgi:beta-glucosidase
MPDVIRSIFSGAVALSLATALLTSPALLPAQEAKLYLDPSQPIDKRVDDLVSRMTLEEKVSQLIDRAPAIPRLDVSAYNWWNEGLHGIARSGYATGLSPGYRQRRHMGRPLGRRHLDHDLH